MTLQHSYTYAATLADAQKVNWRVDDLIGGAKRLDFGKPFLPDTLARVAELDFLSPEEKRVLNHIRGATYLHIFGLVEEFILAFAVDRVQDQIHGDKDRARAILTFAEEEAKHQTLFQRFSEEFAAGFPEQLELIGPAVDVSKAVLSHGKLGVAILILCLEWLTQRHYIESVKTDETIDPLFADLLRHHWQEEAQHAKIDTLVVAELASKATPAEVEKGIDDFLAIGGLLEASLRQQVRFDIGALERSIGRRLPPSDRARLEDAQIASYRWTFLVSGLEHPNFLRAVGDLTPRGRDRVLEAARALSTSPSAS